MTYTIGLTGNIACGKSTVGRRLVELGADYLDTDQVVHGLLGGDTVAARAIVQRFGASVRQPDGSINRAALGAIVFADAGQLRALEGILYPQVEAIVHQRIASTSSDVLVIDGVRIVESGLASELDELWVVTCSAEVQRRRLATDRGLNDQEIAVRLKSQPSSVAKLARANVVIDNSGSLDETLRQIDSAFREVRERLPS